ncbi:MAG: signal peptidase I [Ottowia sp.]
MPIFTGIILAGFAAYCLAWYFGAIQGSYPVLLLTASVVTGLYWLAERMIFLPRRKAAAAALQAQYDARQAQLTAQNITIDNSDDIQEAKKNLLKQPWWLDWTAGLFPIILAVFLLRSFVFEPFRIPSGSMIPTLQIDDLILVNKFTYGIRLPVINKRITNGEPVQRGDVIVFHYPLQTDIDYIKRVIGLPGDEVAYINKEITINGTAVNQTPAGDFLDKSTMQYFKQFTEQAPSGKSYSVMLDDKAPPFIMGVESFKSNDMCQYSVEGVRCKVPEGHFFVMGDNRDHSLDSRYWGFVPENLIVGKAFFIWMNLGNFSRIGSFN